MLSSAIARSMRITPSASGGVVRTAISSALSALRASPSAIDGEMRSASSSASTAMFAEAALLVRQRRAAESHEVRRRERLELKDLGARDQRAVDVEERIVRRRADEPHRAALDIRQQHVLLRFVPAMDFVDEEDRLLRRCSQPIRRRRDRRGADPPRCSRRRSAARSATSSRCAMICASVVFPCPAGHEQNDGNAIRLDRAPQQFARPEDVFLPRIFIQRPRTHPLRERRRRRHRGRLFLLTLANKSSDIPGKLARTRKVSSGEIASIFAVRNRMTSHAKSGHPSASNCERASRLETRRGRANDPWILMLRVGC